MNSYWAGRIDPSFGVIFSLKKISKCLLIELRRPERESATEGIIEFILIVSILLFKPMDCFRFDWGPRTNPISPHFTFRIAYNLRSLRTLDEGDITITCTIYTIPNRNKQDFSLWRNPCHPVKYNQDTHLRDSCRRTIQHQHVIDGYQSFTVAF